MCQAGQKTTTCGHCGRTLVLEQLKKHLVTDDPDAASQAAGMLNARLSGTLEAFDQELLPPPPPPRPGDRAVQLRKLALDLAGAGPFDEAAFEAALRAQGWSEDAGRELARLVEAGVLYEPRPGRFAAL